VADGDGELSALTPTSSLPVTAWSYLLAYSNEPWAEGRVTKTVCPGWMSPLSQASRVQVAHVAVCVARVSFSKAILAPALTERTLGEKDGDADGPVIFTVASAPVCGSTMNSAENAIAAGNSE